MSLYDARFYDLIDNGAIASANVVAPQVLEVFSPSSVVDLGCGTGAWLSAFSSLGISDIFGIDGEYNDFAPKILGDKFLSADLSRDFSLNRKFDLAVTLEVAEHLPSSSAEVFVDNVCRLSDNILWSAAVPGQRGVDHINEQFPSYWVPMFEKRGYKCDGDFRFQFWYNEDVETWYRQNILLFSKSFTSSTSVRDLIHPNNYSNYGEIEDRYVY